MLCIGFVYVLYKSYKGFIGCIYVFIRVIYVLYVLHRLCIPMHMQSNIKLCSKESVCLHGPIRHSKAGMYLDLICVLSLPTTPLIEI